MFLDLRSQLFSLVRIFCDSKHRSLRLQTLREQSRHVELGRLSLTWVAHEKMRIGLVQYRPRTQANPHLLSVDRDFGWERGVDQQSLFAERRRRRDLPRTGQSR